MTERPGVPEHQSGVAGKRSGATTGSRAELLCFYALVLALALAGQITGLHSAGAPWAAAGAVGAGVEGAGVVLFRYSAARRSIGERAIIARLMSAGVAGWAVGVNAVTHDRIWGPILAGLSGLGYIVWVLASEADRRDALRANKKLPPVPPSYEMIGHWLRHPWLTLRARALAKANPSLGTYESLDAAREQVRREQREQALTRVLGTRIKDQLGPDQARLVEATYDMEQIASRLRSGADYDGYAAILSGELTPDRISGALPPRKRSTPRAISATPETGKPERSAASPERSTGDGDSGAPVSPLDARKAEDAKYKAALRELRAELGRPLKFGDVAPVVGGGGSRVNRFLEAIRSEERSGGVPERTTNEEETA